MQLSRAPHLVLGFFGFVRNFLKDLPSDERNEVLDFLNEGFRDREPQGPTTQPPVPASDPNDNTLEGYLEHVKILGAAVKESIDTIFDAVDGQEDVLDDALNNAWNAVTGDRWFIFDYLHPFVLKFSETFYATKLTDLGLNYEEVQKISVVRLARLCMLVDILRAAYGEENLKHFNFDLYY